MSPVALALVDSALGILLEAGCSPEQAVTLFHITSCFVVGHALDESGDRRAGRHAASVTPDDTFEAGLAALLDSVADRR